MFRKIFTTIFGIKHQNDSFQSIKQSTIILTNDFLEPILENLLEHCIKESAPQKSKLITNIYYTGGTLCIDFVDDDSNEQVCTISILDATFGWFSGNDTNRNDLSDKNLQLAFDIYKAVKGETDYYKIALKKIEIESVLC